MTNAEFWEKAEQIFKRYHTRAGQFITSDPTGDEHSENVADFLYDMNVLADDWYNRKDDKDDKETDHGNHPERP